MRKRGAPSNARANNSRRDLKFSPTLFGALLTGSAPWEIRLAQARLEIRQRNKAETSALKYAAITAVRCEVGWFWARLHLKTAKQRLTFSGLGKSQGQRLSAEIKQRVGAALTEALSAHRPTLQTLEMAWSDFLDRPQFLAFHDVQVWQASLNPALTKGLRQAAQLLRHPLLPKRRTTTDLTRQIIRLTEICSGQSEVIRQHNQQFISEEIAKYQAFFDTVESTPLTQEQRIAAVVMEDRNLLVAAAGSGKTSTVIGKIGYALLTEQMAPADILVLAFNTHAARELEARLNARLKSRLPRGQAVKVKTFHALGLEIIAKGEGQKPSLANVTGDNEAADAMWMELLMRELVATDSAFAGDWATFGALCGKHARNPHEFTSQAEWNRYVRTTGDYQDGQTGYLTLNGELVKSQGELVIANWLFTQGVPYEYEKPYRYDTEDRNDCPYRPAFFLPTIDSYVEHYAVDPHGHPPKAFEDRYREFQRWKQALPKQVRPQVIDTTFADVLSGQLFSKLKRQLSRRGITLHPLSAEDILNRLNQHQRTDYGPLLRACIKHAKANELDPKALKRRADDQPHPFRARLFARILTKLLQAYEAKLRQQGELDFEDLIGRATRHVMSGRYRQGFRLILVDEFQDISQGRAKLLKALLDQAPACKLFAVGDDWQSIYRFAGADIDLFTRYADYFGATATNYLTQTFRGNQGIADVAAAFVQKNPAQLSKRIEAQDPQKEDVIVIRRYSRLREIDRHIEACLAEIAAGASREQTRRTVFLLGRYRHQQPAALEQWQHSYPDLEMSYRTIHATKGLQADAVILLGLHAGRHAFPSEVADDPLLQLVMPQPEQFPDAEERRLFYVALTRAKHRVYLLGGQQAPSRFLTEILGDSKLQAMLQVADAEIDTQSDKPPSSPQESCPQCGRGKLRPTQGKSGRFLGCSDYPACRYTRDMSASKKNLAKAP